MYMYVGVVFRRRSWFFPASSILLLSGEENKKGLQLKANRFYGSSFVSANVPMTGVLIPRTNVTKRNAGRQVSNHLLWKKTKIKCWSSSQVMGA